MRVVRIDPLESLSKADKAALHTLVAHMPSEVEDTEGWLAQDLIVYVTDEQEIDGTQRRLVAPRSPAIQPRDWVMATGWTATLAESTTDPERASEPSIHAAGSIVHVQTAPDDDHHGSPSLRHARR